MGAFGDKFRTERERRGFTLDDVSNVTKINSRMLKAIEDEHFDLLPGGVFNKGFVRAYANHLGFNDEESVSEYLAALRQAQIQAQTAAWEADVPPQLRVEQRRAGQIQTEQIQTQQVRPETVRVDPNPSTPNVKVSPNKTVPDGIKLAIKYPLKQEVKQEVRQDAAPAQQARESIPAQVEPAAQQPPAAQLNLRGAPRADSIPWKVPAVVLAVILVAAVLWNRHSRGVRAEGATHLPESRIAAATNPVETNPAAAAATSSSPGSNRSSNSGSPSSSPGGTNQDLSSSPAAAAREREAAQNHSEIDHADTDVAPSDHAGVATVRKFPGPAPATQAPPVFTLRIRASENTWISVTADGQPATQETLIAPAGTSIRASREIVVRVGNAAGVSFLLNGKEIPPQGNEAEVKTLVFDSAGIVAPGQAPDQDR